MRCRPTHGQALRSHQQGAATSDIAHNASSAASGTHEVSLRIAAVSQTARETETVVERVSTAANRVFSETERMQTDVQRFLSQVRHLIAGTVGVETEIPSLQWSDVLSVGHQGIDQDHRRLFQLFNDLSRAMRNGKTKNAIAPVLDALIDYAAVHFKREEEIMAAGNFPDLAAHRKQHEAFVAKAQSVRDQFRVSQANTLAIARRPITEAVTFPDQCEGQDLQVAERRDRGAIRNLAFN